MYEPLSGGIADSGRIEKGKITQSIMTAVCLDRVQNDCQIDGTKHSTPKRAAGATKVLAAQKRKEEKLPVIVIAFITSGCIILFLNSLKGDHAPESADLGMNRNSPIASAVEDEHHLQLQPPDPPYWSNYSNIHVPSGATYTDTLHRLLQRNGSTFCHNQTTNYTKLEGLPELQNGKVLLKYNTKYSLTLSAYTVEGERRCSGGDYFEVDFHNTHYRSRLPTIDYDNGTYGLELVVPDRWAGVFTLDIWFLFPNWHGMNIETENFAVLQVVNTQELHVVLPEDETLDATILPRNLSRCTKEDFDRPHWSGRWTRGWLNESCQADGEKRYKCLPADHSYCEEPWCSGPLYRLESNGWSYSAHCSFKLFERDEAWNCLNNRWLLLWGDSNFQDTVRNLLLFILDWPLPKNENLADFQMEREYERFFIHPDRPDQYFQVSSVFNAAHQWWDNGEGLRSLDFDEHKDKIMMHFRGSRSPDTIIMNSGLHDNLHEFEDYLGAADRAVQWWVELYKQIPADRKPSLVWRTTVAPAGASRSMPGNPNKMEVYNHIMVEKLKAVRHEMPVKFVDGFDLTFPFHYTNEFSDGAHYGRAPGVNLKPWFREPHWYFVDIMLAHIFLNSICPDV